jgi:hypothetical protein
MCSVVTLAQVSAVLGATASVGDVTDHTRGCAWLHNDANGIPTQQAALTVDRGTSFASLCNKPSNPALGITITPVSGVGDGACLVELAGIANLTFEKGGQVYGVTVNLPGGTPTATIEAAERTLAAEAAANL